MRVLRFATVAALALTLSATSGDAKKNKQKQCHNDAGGDSVAPATITITPSASTPTTTPTDVPVTTPPLATATPIATPHSTETAAPDATSSPNKSKASGLKLKLFKKADLDGKKVVVKTVNDVCYSVDTCFDDLTSSLAWSKTPSDAKAIELFASVACAGASVSINDLGAAGGSGNVTSLKSLGFNNQVSSFVVRSVAANGLIVSQDSGCSSEDSDDDKDDTAAPATSPPVVSTAAPSPQAATVVPEASTPTPVATTSVPAPVTTVKPPKPKGLKVKLYKKVDLKGDGDDKLVVPTLSDVCYTVDVCFDDATKSLEWSKVPSDVTRIELFEAARCTGASVAITDLGVVGGGGNVTTLKDLNFMKKLSAFVVRSTTGGNAITTYDDGCAANAVTDSA